MTDSQSTHSTPTFSNVQQPLIVDSASDIEWSDESDIVVVGFGAAGASAALQACECGSSVIVVDRFEGGGDTALSGGVFYAGGGTRVQKEAGCVDDAENMFNYLKQETLGIVKDETLMRFCEQSVDNFNWLEDNGVQFKSTMSPVKTSYPRKNYYYYYSGNETVPAYTKTAQPVPRGHRAVGKGLSGSAFFRPLKESALQKGVKLWAQSQVTRIVLDRHNEVLGVELQVVAPMYREQHRKLHEAVNRWRMWAPSLTSKYRKQSKQLEKQQPEKRWIRAKKGVILSAGGFVFNRKMLEHYAPKYKKSMPLGTTGANGSGIELGLSMQAKSDHMNNVSVWRFINPPYAWAKGILVNADGQRFVNEQCYGAKIGYEMCEFHEGKAYLILNSKLYWKALRQAFPGRIWLFQTVPAYLCALFASKKAHSLSELATKLDMPAENLEQAVAKYNAAALGEEEDEQGKALDFMQSMEQGKYYALDVSITSKLFPLPAITLGGLCVDEETGQVLDQSSQPIAKLYAAGRTAVGVASNLYVSGLSIADCVFSGRRAGKHASKSI